MKIFNVPIDLDAIKSNLDELSDSGRFLMVNEDKELLELLDYENDSPFLEPSLFSYFIHTDMVKDTTLDQVVWGHINAESRRKSIKVRSDGQGLIHIPEVGYIKVDIESQILDLEYQNDTIKLKFEGKEIAHELIDFIYLKNSDIKVCYHEPSILTGHLQEEFRNPVLQSCNEYKDKLDLAFEILGKISPDLYELIKMTHKEVFIFNGKQRESLASLSFFGGVLLNTDNQNQNEVFFLDDLAHQCGHTIFYTLTLQASDFLVPDPRMLIREYTKVSWESRNFYNVFHGLFTYTTILDTLDKCVEQKIFEGEKLFEVYARIGFYMMKFLRDLAQMNSNKILTEKGFVYFDYFKSGYDEMELKYKDKYRLMNYDNQEYMFHFQDFLKSNKHVMEALIKS